VSFCNSLEEYLVKELKTWHRGPYQAISSQELGAKFSVDPRRVRAIISHLRQDHKMPICGTSNNGYFWPRQRADANHTIAELKSRLIEIQKTVDGIEEGLEELFGQPSLLDLVEEGKL